MQVGAAPRCGSGGADRGCGASWYRAGIILGCLPPQDVKEGTINLIGWEIAFLGDVSAKFQFGF